MNMPAVQAECFEIVEKALLSHGEIQAVLKLAAIKNFVEIEYKINNELFEEKAAAKTQ